MTSEQSAGYMPSDLELMDEVENEDEVVAELLYIQAIEAQLIAQSNCIY